MKPKTRLLNVADVGILAFLTVVVVELSAYGIMKLGADQGFYKPGQLNRLGLRDPRDPVDIDNNTVILAIGDSFTFVLGVNYAESYPSHQQGPNGKSFRP